MSDSTPTADNADNGMALVVGSVWRRTTNGAARGKLSGFWPIERSCFAVFLLTLAPAWILGRTQIAKTALTAKPSHLKTQVQFPLIHVWCEFGRDVFR